MLHAPRQSAGPKREILALTPYKIKDQKPEPLAHQNRRLALKRTKTAVFKPASIIFILGIMALFFTYPDSAASQGDCPSVRSEATMSTDGPPGSVNLRTLKNARTEINAALQQVRNSEELAQAIRCALRSSQLRVASHETFFNSLKINVPSNKQEAYGRALGLYAADLIEVGRERDARDIAHSLLASQGALEAFIQEMTLINHLPLASRRNIQDAERNQRIDQYQSHVANINASVDRFLNDGAGFDLGGIASALERDRDRTLTRLHGGVTIYWVVERNDPDPEVGLIDNQPMQLITKRAISQYEIARARLEDRNIGQDHIIHITCAIPPGGEVPPKRGITRIDAHLLEVAEATYTFRCEM